MQNDCLDQINSLIWEAYVKSVNCDAEGRYKYICCYVHRRLRSFVWENRSFYIQRDSSVKHKLESHRMDLDKTAPSGQDDQGMKELYETLYSCCLDNIDQRIVEMRTQFYKNEEIISQLDLSPATFYRRLHDIVERFKDALL